MSYALLFDQIYDIECEITRIDQNILLNDPKNSDNVFGQSILNNKKHKYILEKNLATANLRNIILENKDTFLSIARSTPLPKQVYFRSNELSIFRNKMGQNNFWRVISVTVQFNPLPLYLRKLLDNDLLSSYNLINLKFYFTKKVVILIDF